MDSTGSSLAVLRRPISLVGLATLAGLAGAALFVACGNVVLDDAGAISAGGSGGTGGTGGVGGRIRGGTGGAGGGPMCTLTSTGTGGNLTQLTECIDPPGSNCPNQYNAAQYITPHGCAYLVSVDCGPAIEAGQCCYLVTEQAHACVP